MFSIDANMKNYTLTKMWEITFCIKKKTMVIFRKKADRFCKKGLILKSDRSKNVCKRLHGERSVVR